MHQLKNNFFDCARNAITKIHTRNNMSGKHILPSLSPSFDFTPSSLESSHTHTYTDTISLWLKSRLFQAIKSWQTARVRELSILYPNAIICSHSGASSVCCLPGELDSMKSHSSSCSELALTQMPEYDFAEMVVIFDWCALELWINFKRSIDDAWSVVEIRYLVAYTWGMRILSDANCEMIVFNSGMCV